QGAGAAVDGRADIYAYGLILYELLTGPRQVTATTARERIEAMRQRSAPALPPIRDVDESIPAPLAVLVMRCLERAPEARYQTSAQPVTARDELDERGAPGPR